MMRVSFGISRSCSSTAERNDGCAFSRFFTFSFCSSLTDRVRSGPISFSAGGRGAGLFFSERRFEPCEPDWAGDADPCVLSGLVTDVDVGDAFGDSPGGRGARPFLRRPPGVSSVLELELRGLGCSSDRAATTRTGRLVSTLVSSASSSLNGEPDIGVTSLIS